MRGLLAGGFWGLMVGSVAVVAASLWGQQPAGNTPPATPQVSAPETADQIPGESATAVALPDVTGPTAQDALPQVAAPTVDDATPVTDTAPARLPDASDITQAPTAPAPSQAPVITAAAEDPVLPNPQSLAPQVPVTEDDLVVSTAPAAPPTPPQEVTTPVDDTAPDVTQVAPQAPEQSPTADIGLTVATGTDTAPETATTPLLPATDADVAPSADAMPAAVPAAPQVPSDAPEAPVVVSIIAEPAPSLPTGDSGVRVNRLTDDQAVENPQDTEIAQAAEPQDVPAYLRYAAPSANPENKPTVAIVLIDDGSFAGAVPALAGIPFPVTVMLSPGAADAAEKMVAYRAAGIEVGVLATLPPDPTPSDVAVFFEAAFSGLPETVAVLDTGEAGLQGSNETILQAIDALASDTRGLITISRGLNTALREAEKAGVPTGVVYRDMDSEGQNAQVIRRFMDQAAFRARQESGVVLLGRVRADTISALILWGTANRAGQVSMVPITAVFEDQ